jgi:DNA transposition AAA+ family ATPase
MKKKQTEQCTKRNTQTTVQFYTRVKNMTNIQFSHEEEQMLKLGLNYTSEKNPKQFLQDLIIDTENAIRQLKDSEQNAYRLLACKKIKQIQNNNTTNILHKRQNYIITQIRKKTDTK